MQLINAACDRWGSQHVTLWKKDLRDAFGLLWTAPQDVPLVGIPLTDNLVLFSLCASFGLGGLPPTFGVITRAVVALVSAAIEGYCSAYVDDVFGASPAISASPGRRHCDKRPTRPGGSGSKQERNGPRAGHHRLAHQPR